MTNLYTTSKSKALNFNYRPDKLVSFNRDEKNILKGYSPAALLRESTNIANSFSVRFDETAPSNETRAFNWASALKNEKLVYKLITNDREIEQVALDLPNQRVVNTDCMRTRVGILDDSMRDSLERLLTFYCKRERITYKQGLNEVAAPFVYFLKAQVRISNIYNYFVLFVDKFLPTSFVDKDFITLQCYFRTLELLLKYHDANFHTFLTINELPSELYATPWFLTLFASKLSLDMVYFLWDICILETDPCFKFFIGLALLLENKNLIIGSETPMIPQSLANLTIKNSTAMKQIYKRAVELRMKTPVSFLGKIRELDLFNRDYQSSEELKTNMQKNLDYLQSLQCILVSTYELTNALFYNEILCSDPICSNYKKLEASDKSSSSIYTRAGSFDVLKPENDKKPKKVMTPKNLSYYEQKDPRKEVLSKGLKQQCILCQTENSSTGNLTIMSHLKELVNYKQALKLEAKVEQTTDFFIIDLRQSRNGGSLPKSQKVSFSKALEETINLLINDLIEMQSKYHFVFMISNFNSWVFKDLVESKDIKTRRGMSEALKSERGALRGGNISVEDEWLMAFLDAFIQNGFPYLSILEGGYEEVNRTLHSLNLTPLNHNAEYCQVCHPNEVKSPSFFNLINKVIDKTGETLGMIVDGIGNNGLDSSRAKRKIDVSEKLDTSITKTASQGLFNFNSPKMSGITPEKHKIPVEDLRQSSDYLLGSSPYKSQASSMQSLESLANGLTKYLQDDHPNQLHAGDTDYLEESHSGRITAPGKIMSSSSLYNTGSHTSLSKGGYTTGSQPSLQKISIPIYTSPNQSSQGTKTSIVSTKSTFAPYRTNIGGSVANKPEITRQMSKERKTEPNQELLLSNIQYGQNESEFGNTTMQPMGLSSLQNQHLSLSRIVSEPIKKQTDEFDMNMEYVDLTVRKMTHQDRKNISSLNTPNKIRTDKPVTYSNYVSPALNNMFKPIKQVERDHRSGIYDHESGIKPFDLDVKQESDKSEKSYKEASIYDTLQTDPIHDHKNKSAYIYNNLSGMSLTVPSKNGDYGSANSSSSSKKINIAQLLKEPTFTTAGTRSPVTAYPVISSQDNHHNYGDYLGRSSVQPDKSFHLDTFGGDVTSNREISSLRAITQSPSPKKVRGREIIDIRRTTDTADNMSSFPSYTDPVSPVSRNLGNSGFIREESVVSGVSESSYYERNGIFKEFRLSQNGIFWLYKAFENVEFSLYACNYVKEAIKDEGGLIKQIGDSNKRIIITSKDFLVALQFRQEIMEDLQLLQVGVTVDRILKRSRGKSHDKGFHSVYGTADSSPKTYEAVVQAIFPIKLLLRITSKKADAKFLSFYFKLPSLEKVLSMNASKFFNFSESNIQELPELMKKEGYMRMIRELCDSKDLSTCVQSKSVYCFDSSFNAQECIKKTKEAYGSASSYLHEKLKKSTTKF